MQALLTHVGQRWTLHHLKTLPPHGLPVGVSPREWKALLELLRCKVLPYRGLEALADRGLIEPCSQPLDEDALTQRFYRNPLENLRRVSLEITTECASNCLHCRNGRQITHREEHPLRLAPCVDLLVDMGIPRFDFIGGEVIQFGGGWLDLVRHIRHHRETAVSVLTSGWFLGARDFVAAGRRYASDTELLKDLAHEGVTHLAFSVDGPREVHDRWRHCPGMYDKVLKGFTQARQAGLQPQVSLIRTTESITEPWLMEVAQALYAPQLEEPLPALVQRMLYDEHNLVNNLIDIGNARSLRMGRLLVTEVEDDLLRCKNFFRPCPALRLTASGEVGTCPLLGQVRGYGNLHGTSLLEILNRMHETPLFRLHAENRLGMYRALLDPGIFGERIDHVCSLRVALTQFAVAMEHRNIDPRDSVEVRRINEEVAQTMGILDRS